MSNNDAISSRREALPSFTNSRSLDHPGLAFSRYLETTGDNHAKAAELLDALQNSKAGDAYKRAYDRWVATVTKVPGTKPFPLALAGPLAIGLGNESPLEVGLTLHHTYGMPIIPGSALKGLCRRGAQLLRNANKISSEQFLALFGSADNGVAQASTFVFWDAWYDPKTVGGMPLHRDVVTVHHPDYYSTRGKDGWPTDFDDPNPIPFLVVRPKAGFLFAVTAPTPEWRNFVERLLRWSLENLGAGAKTNAGYGFFQDVPTFEGSAPRPTAGEVWKGVPVRWDPGQRAFAAFGERNQKAEARGSAAAKIFTALPEGAQAALKSKKRTITADVEVTRRGNAWEITKITPREG
ncbi:MAG: type III-B CRISPR module RAMP protein Cmr6 [Chthonomonadales bacterium]